MKKLFYTTILLLAACSLNAQTAKTRANLYTDVDALPVPITRTTLLPLLKNAIASGHNVSTDGAALTSAEAASTYLTQANALLNYQPLLVSGTSIKTVNGTSLLGSGDITITGGGSLDVDALTTGTNTDLGSTDNLAISDGGTEKKYTLAEVFTWLQAQSWNFSNATIGVLNFTTWGTGTVPDANVAATIARDSEVTAAVAAEAAARTAALSAEATARDNAIAAAVFSAGAGAAPGTVELYPTAMTLPAGRLLADGTNGTENITGLAGTKAAQVANATLTAPAVTPASGTYTAAQTVTATADAGATVFYEIGADPTRASSVYSAPITASTSAEYRFAQAKSPGLLSPITTRSYTISLGSGYVSAVLADSPIAYWRLNDDAPSGAGSIADFSAGGTYDATPVGGITWNAAGSLSDGLGEAALFNGSTGYATGGTALAAALMNSATWTIEAWAYTPIANGGYIFAAASDATHRVAIQHFGGKIYTSSTVGGNKSGPTGSAIGNWHHIVLTSTGVLYVDGVAADGTSSATLNSTVQVVVGALNSGASFFTGRVSEVAMYTSVLDATRVAAHWVAANTFTMPTGQVFSMSMAATTPEVYTPGSDDTGLLDNGSSFVDDGGVNVLEVGGATFRALTFDNPTAYNKWLPYTGGTVELEFKYSGTLGNFMLMQITGKDRSGGNDTNDGVKLVINPTGGAGVYSYANGASTVTANVTTTLTAGTWYTARIKWRTSGSPTLSVTINSVEATSTTGISDPTCTAWHHLLIGNDTNTTPTSLRIRNVKTYGSWQ